jgi:hypothetical protein
LSRPWPGRRQLKRVEPIVNRALSRLGLEISRIDEHRARYKNFETLCDAYEQKLAEAGEPVPADSSRRPLLARLHGTSTGEAYFVIAALGRARSIEGDVCEFGVAQGETSTLIANEIRDGVKTLHLFDSFQGLPAPTTEDELKDDIFANRTMAAYAGTMCCPEDMVHARLAAITFPRHRYVVHKGFIDEVLALDRGLPERVSFAYLDFDFYEPTKVTLAYLAGVLSPGATIVVDDYDFFSTGAKTAVDEFVAARAATGAAWTCDVPDAAYGHFAVLRRADA